MVLLKNSPKPLLINNSLGLDFCVLFVSCLKDTK